MDMFAKVLLEILWIILTASNAANAVTMFQASSEGTDCRCKCIVTAQDGGPCETQPGEKKTVYSVETISGGNDCRCACDTPPPSGCQAAPQERKVVQPDVDNLGQVDLVELHGTISNMVSAMIKLEKAIAQSRSENQRDTMRDNVNKVISYLESTNGSYSNEVKDMTLNTYTERAITNMSTTPSATTDTSAILQAVNSTTQTGTTERAKNNDDRDDRQQYEGIGVVPKVSTSALTLTTEQTTQKREVISNTASVNAGKPDTISSNVVDVQTTGKPEVAQSTTSMPTTRTPIVTTTSTTTLPPVKPRMVFVPYRSLKTPQSHVPIKNRFREVEYDYDNFDIDAVTEKATTTQRVPSTLTTTSKTSPRINVTTVSTTTTEGDESYADHLDEYEYVDYYDEETKSTTTTTTTLATTTEPIDPCGTLFSISRPIVRSHFGRREGAWMKDPVPSKTDPTRNKRVYVANFYYGSSLIEFDGVESIRRLRYRNLYNLPHKWSGTGHIVYNGSFYYNRAFSTALIKYNLRYRFVSAWTHLASVVYNTRSPLTWKGHTGVHLAADEGGLWTIFPSQDPFDPHAKGTYIVNKINPVDLRVLESYKTKIRHSVSHAFMICGILYTTDHHNSRRARVNNAFDTRTLSQRNSYLGFENMFSYAVQFSYNPNEKKIYAWDNGRQVEYKVGLIH